MDEDSEHSHVLQRIRDAEHELNQAIAEWRTMSSLVRKRAMHFTKEIRAAHRTLRRSVWKQVTSASFLYWLTAPVIYALIVPLALLDISTSIFQLACFPVYRIARVRRSDYVVVDRHRLSYLNSLEKVNCVYCGYANGVISYAREVASRTEQFFCPIKHAIAVPGTHTRYSRFAEYGDATGFHALREQSDRAAQNR